MASSASYPGFLDSGNSSGDPKVYSSGALKWWDLGNDSNDDINEHKTDLIAYTLCPWSVGFYIFSCISWHQFTFLVGDFIGVGGIAFVQALETALKASDSILIFMLSLELEVMDFRPVHCQTMVDLLPSYFPGGLAVTFPKYYPVSFHFWPCRRPVLSWTSKWEQIWM